MHATMDSNKKRTCNFLVTFKPKNIQLWVKYRIQFWYLFLPSMYLSIFKFICNSQGCQSRSIVSWCYSFHALYGESITIRYNYNCTCVGKVGIPNLIQNLLHILKETSIVQNFMSSNIQHGPVITSIWHL